MIETVFLVVPRSDELSNSGDMKRVVDDVADRIFESYDEIQGFALGRFYDKWRLWTAGYMADAHNDEYIVLSESLIFPLRYKCDDD